MPAAIPHSPRRRAAAAAAGPAARSVAPARSRSRGPMALRGSYMAPPGSTRDAANDMPAQRVCVCVCVVVGWVGGWGGGGGGRGHTCSGMRTVVYAQCSRQRAPSAQPAFGLQMTVNSGAVRHCLGQKAPPPPTHTHHPTTPPPTSGRCTHRRLHPPTPPAPTPAKRRLNAQTQAGRAGAESRGRATGSNLQEARDGRTWITSERRGGQRATAAALCDAWLGSSAECARPGGSACSPAECSAWPGGSPAAGRRSGSGGSTWAAAVAPARPPVQSGPSLLPCRAQPSLLGLAHQRGGQDSGEQDGLGRAVQRATSAPAPLALPQEGRLNAADALDRTQQPMRVEKERDRERKLGRTCCVLRSARLGKAKPLGDGPTLFVKRAHASKGAPGLLGRRLPGRSPGALARAAAPQFCASACQEPHSAARQRLRAYWRGPGPFSGAGAALGPLSARLEGNSCGCLWYETQGAWQEPLCSLELAPRREK